MATKEGLIIPEKSVQIGIRTWVDDKLGFNILDAMWVHDKGAKATVQEIKKIVGKTPTYLTFDIDSLDPAYAPGTGTPVVGGLTTHQALSILRSIDEINLIGMDIVEVAPAYDHAEITAIAAATIVYNYICMFTLNKSTI